MNVMKWQKLILSTTAILLLTGLMVSLFLSTPQRLGINKGSLKMTIIDLDHKKYVMINGSELNYLGQLQAITIHFDSQNNIYVNKIIIYWHPFFMMVPSCANWPVLVDMSYLNSGQHRVYYWSSDERYDLLGLLNVM